MPGITAQDVVVRIRSVLVVVERAANGAEKDVSTPFTGYRKNEKANERTHPSCCSNDTMMDCRRLGRGDNTNCPSSSSPGKRDLLV